MSKYNFSPSAVCEGIVGAIFIAVTVVTSPLFQRWYRRWGTTASEAHQNLPGDELVPHPKIESIRAITIKAPAANVWQWLLQIGLNRGGWYSYDFLETIAGAGDFVDGHSAKRIIPELQNLKVGDKIWMHPKILPLSVTALEPEKALIFHTRVDVQTKTSFELSDKMPDQYVNSSWVFFLDKSNEKATRLLVRSRLDYDSSLINTIAWRVFTDPFSFVMEYRMLLGIKQRAEALAKSKVSR